MKYTTVAMAVATMSVGTIGVATDAARFVACGYVLPKRHGGRIPQRTKPPHVNHQSRCHSTGPTRPAVVFHASFAHLGLHRWHRPWRMRMVPVRVWRRLLHRRREAGGGSCERRRYLASPGEGDGLESGCGAEAGPAADGRQMAS